MLSFIYLFILGDILFFLQLIMLMLVFKSYVTNLAWLKMATRLKQKEYIRTNA